MSKNLYDKLGYFSILDVTPDAPEDEIRQKYRELAKFWHPDHNPAPEAMDTFQKISAAYEVLKDEKSRLKYILLSIIYSTENFPDMNAISLIRNMHGQEDLNLRAFHLTEITGKGLKHTSIDKIYYCSQYEAAGVIGNITRHNWFYGFWGITAFFANIKAIIQNIRRINSFKDNLLLMLHNSLVLEAEGKTEEAATLATLAKEYADKNEIFYIDKYLAMLGQYSLLSVKRWNFKKLSRIQLFYPLALVLFLGLVFGLFAIKEAQKNNASPDIKQVVVFNNGQKIFSDVSVAKIFDIPVDVHDKQKLYHLTETSQVMHGADKSFDVYGTVEINTTVRITGYTADKKWLRVMLDNGEMVFIETEKVQQGIGKEIPLWSKIYKEE